MLSLARFRRVILSNVFFSDDPTTWLKKHLSGTIDRVGIAQVLPWKIGIKFVISAIGGIHIILQDILRTDCMMLFFAGRFNKKG